MHRHGDVKCAVKMIRKDKIVLSLRLQPVSEEVKMFRKDKSVLSLRRQPDSGEMGMLGKAIFVLSPGPQPETAGRRSAQNPKARNEFLNLDIYIYKHKDLWKHQENQKLIGLHN